VPLRTGRVAAAVWAVSAAPRAPVSGVLGAERGGAGRDVGGDGLLAGFWAEYVAGESQEKAHETLQAMKPSTATVASSTM
jgi:hypothetical protein